MCAFVTVRVLWIPLVCFCHLVLAQVAEMSEEEQREKLIRAFKDCHQQMLSQPQSLTGLFCNRTWDNVMCWPDTAAGTVGYQRCPSYINGFDHAEYATKHCLENGTWFTSQTSGRPWTNYTACFAKGPTTDNALPPLIVEHMPGIKLMYTIGYSLSLAALILAVSIMIYFRRLHCSRNMIHLNMFLAFLVRAAFSLIRTVLLVQDLGFPNDVNNTGERIIFIQEGTHWECKLFFTLFYYSLLASLMWLFNEGLYLVLILSVSVFVEKTKIRWFVLLGWGIPVIFVIPWVICRIEYDDMLCWNIHVQDKLFWILRGPMVVSVAVNFIFFIVIIRMLFSKLTASNCPESKKVRYRKLAKSTLILIPLFAVYYMGFIWLPDDISPASDLFKLYVEMLFNSFQGFLVALLFCFLNAEVQNEIRKKWHVIRRRGSWRSQPSNGSYLRRGGAKSKDVLRRPSQSRSFLDSTVTTRDHHHHLHPASASTPYDNKLNGKMSAIGEESAPLTDAGMSGEVGVELSLQKDFHSLGPPGGKEDVEDTGFSEGVDVSCDDVTGIPRGDDEPDQERSTESGDDAVVAGRDRDEDDKCVFQTNLKGYSGDVPGQNDLKERNGDVTRACDVIGSLETDVNRKFDVEVYTGDFNSSYDGEVNDSGADRTLDGGDCGMGIHGSDPLITS